MKKPQLTHDVYWNRYIDLVGEDDIVGALERQRDDLSQLLGGINEEKSTHRYEPGKWSIKELVQHVTDTERVFGYRALSIARGETRSLPGFDEKMFAANAEAERRAFRSIAEEFLAVRGGTIALFRGLPEAAWQRVGVANDNRIGVGSLAYVTAGHARHHEKILRERYLQSRTEHEGRGEAALLYTGWKVLDSP